MSFIPSTEQAAIFDYIEAHRTQPGRKALAVAALAGTGKTTTALELIRRVPGCEGIYCAFNKSIANEVKPKLAGTRVDAKTFHSMGYGTLLSHLKKQHGIAQFKTDENKYKDICADEVQAADALQPVIRDAAEIMLQADYGDQPIPPAELDFKVKEVTTAVIQFLKELTRFVRLKLAQWDDLPALRRLAGRVADDEILTVDLITACLPLVQPIMEQAEADARLGTIDFTDMIYWNVHWNLALPKYKWIFVDEAQDLSPMQREMVYRSAADASFTVIIGDANQAVYAFAGADSDSWDLTVTKFQAATLPLSVTRRCAQIITQHAQTIVPQFRAMPDAPRGKIVWWPEKRLHEVAQPGDLVVCRLKAPVVGACLSLIARNIPATVLGSDIGKSLVSILEKVQKRHGFSFADAVKHIEAYGWNERAKWLKKGDERRAAAAKDESDALIFIIEEMQPKPTCVDDVSDFIKTLFADEDKASVVTFATGHKSKGLEAEWVFILAPDRMPLVYPKMTVEELQQEDNLHYVAITRAKRTLVMLTNDAFLEKQGKTRPPYVQLDFADHDWASELPASAASLPTPAEAPAEAALVERKQTDIWDNIAANEEAMDNEQSHYGKTPAWHAMHAEHQQLWAEATADCPAPTTDDETVEATLLEPVIEPDVADMAEAKPVSPAGEKPLVLIPVVAPAAPLPEAQPDQTALNKLKSQPLQLEAEAEPVFVASGNLSKDMQRYSDQTRQRLLKSFQRLSLAEAELMREVLNEAISILHEQAVTV